MSRTSEPAPANGSGPRLRFPDIVRTQRLAAAKARSIYRSSDRLGGSQGGRQGKWAEASTLHLFSERDKGGRQSCCARAPVAHLLTGTRCVFSFRQGSYTKGSLRTSCHFRSSLESQSVQFVQIRENNSLICFLGVHIDSATAPVIAACLQELGSRNQPPHVPNLHVSGVQVRILPQREAHRRSFRSNLKVFPFANCRGS